MMRVFTDFDRLSSISRARVMAQKPKLVIIASPHTLTLGILYPWT